MTKKTKTAEKPKAEKQAQAEVPESKGQIVHLQPIRLPYDERIQAVYGIDKAAWRVLVETTYPAAKTVEAVLMAMAYCKRRNLDIFKRPIHIVPMYSTALSRTVETIWPGISELRTTAFRTGSYAGMDAPVYGPMVTKAFDGVIKRRNESDKPVAASVTFPEWCQITVYRMLNGQRHAFVGPKVSWLETFARVSFGVEVPNSMWEKRPQGQIEKCAEAGALRRAFPEEIGNEYAAEEMDGQVIHSDGDGAKDITPARDAGPPRASETPAVAEKTAEPETEQQPEITEDEQQWLLDLEGACGGCEDLSTLAEKQQSVMATRKDKVSEAAWAKAETIVQHHVARINEGDKPEQGDLLGDPRE